MVSSQNKKAILIVLVVAGLSFALGAQFRFPPDRNDKLAKIFTLLDTDLRYFEQTAGIARQIFDQHRKYDVDGCNISVVTAGDMVRSIALDGVSAQCGFKPQGLNRHLKNMTFEQVMADHPYGKFKVTCLQSCGNAVEPSLDYVYGGSHAENWVEHKVSSTDFYLYKDELIEAIERDHGKDAATALDFDMDQYNDLMARIFKKAKVSAYEIGYDL